MFLSVIQEVKAKEPNKLDSENGIVMVKEEDDDEWVHNKEEKGHKSV